MELELECSICCSDFEKKNPSIHCPANDDCGLVCRQCFFRFINEKLTPSCMFCNSEINDDFIKKNSNKKEYDEHKNTRVNIVLSRERSLLPQTQEIINQENELRKKYLRVKNLKEKMVRKRIEIDTFRKSNPGYSKKPTKKNPERKIVYDAYCQLLLDQQSIADIYHKANFALHRNNAPQEVIVTINCPSTDCRGFLSSAYKCGICETYFCPSCHVRKDERNDDDHVCNENDKATILLLKKDTKPCPKCRTPISKIDGCFSENTKIPLYDGSYKMSQDIKIGDVLIGDNGKPRIVKFLSSGEDMMYEIIQNNGENYIVNSKHKLVLKLTSEKLIYWNEKKQFWKINWFNRQTNQINSKQFNTDSCSKEESKKKAEEFKKSLIFNEEIEISIDDYHKLNDSTKKSLFGYKSKYGVDYEKNDVVLDPYIFGLWLGDGTISFPIIASNDIETQIYILGWCEKNNCELIHDGGVKFRIRGRFNTNGKKEDRLAISHGTSSDICKGCVTKKMDICNTKNENYENENIISKKKINPFSEKLREMNIFEQKYIPKMYLLNSRDVRLKILAGIIDSDGHVSKDQKGKRVVIKLSDKILFDDVVYLVRTLGFVVNISKNERRNMKIFDSEIKDYKDQYVLNISGEFLNEIPTLISRKKCVGTLSNKDYLRTNIIVKKLCKNKYYGWEIDGNHRFVLSDFTVVRNCDQMFCIVKNCQTAFSWKTGKIDKGPVHNPEFFRLMREMGITIQRNPLDVPNADDDRGGCGNNIFQDRNYWNIRTRLLTYNVLDKEWAELYRDCLHIKLSIMTKLPADLSDLKSEDLRVKYLKSEIDQEKWFTLLKRRMKKNQKNNEVHKILYLFLESVNEFFWFFINQIKQNGIENENNEERRNEIISDFHSKISETQAFINKEILAINKKYDSYETFYLYGFHLKR